MSAEARQADRRDRLVDAAITVIGEAGAAGLTVHRVCRAAGLNERYFYESFADRDGLLTAVAESAGTRMVGALLGALAGNDADEDPRARATAVIGAGVDLLRDDPRLGVLLQESAAQPVLARMRTELAAGLVTLIAASGLETLHLEPSAAIEKQATFAATMLLGGLFEVLTRWTAGTLELSRDELVDLCVEMFLLVADHAVATWGS